MAISHRSFITCTLLFGALALLLVPVATFAQEDHAVPVREFFRSILGEWIGVCEQSTNGEQAEDKYFHGTVREVDENTFESRFRYFRVCGDTKQPVQAGETTVVTAIKPDGTAESKMTGQGEVMVNDKPKDQEHSLTEVVRLVNTGQLTGEGSGDVSVSGMPLGLGKRGKVSKARSAWKLDGDQLVIDQSLDIGFKVLLIKKSFHVQCRYTAIRGSDVAALINGEQKLASRTAAGPTEGS